MKDFIVNDKQKACQMYLSVWLFGANNTAWSDWRKNLPETNVEAMHFFTKHPAAEAKPLLKVHQDKIREFKSFIASLPIGDPNAFCEENIQKMSSMTTWVLDKDVKAEGVYTHLDGGDYDVIKAPVIESTPPTTPPTGTTTTNEQPVPVPTTSTTTSSEEELKKAQGEVEKFENKLKKAKEEGDPEEVELYSRKLQAAQNALSKLKPVESKTDKKVVSSDDLYEQFREDFPNIGEVLKILDLIAEEKTEEGNNARMLIEMFKGSLKPVTA